jgi:hypothetical protein
MKLSKINKNLKKKRRKRRLADEEDRRKMSIAHDANLLNVAQQMPDRGPDEKYGDMRQYANLDRA